MIDLIRSLSTEHGPVGDEQRIAALLSEYVTPYVDNVFFDTLGNLIVYRKGQHNNERLMFSAHMDEVGVIVTHADDDGFLRFQPLGNIRPQTLLNQQVRFADGTIGTINGEFVSDSKHVTAHTMYIDIGAADAEEALRQVPLGSTACSFGQFTVQHNRLIGKALDNRVGCAVLVQALRQVKQPGSDVYISFTVQEEVGGRGAIAAAYQIEPTVAVTIDGTPAGDTPKANTLPAKLGQGAAIVAKDQFILAHPYVKQRLTALAADQQIPYQLAVATHGKTAASPIHASRAGVQTGGLAIPVRHRRTAGEIADMHDIEACVQLVCALMETPFSS